MKIELPTITEIQQLNELVNLVIPEHWEDYNGHVNIQFYMEMYESGGWPMMESLGAGEDYFKARRCGFFDFEHHVRYLSEIHVGDTVSVYSRLVDLNPKRFQGVMFIINNTREQLASTLEFVSGGVNLDMRKTAPFPDDILAALQKKLNEHQLLEWSSPLCGVMSI